ncbi:PREDICTED: olfactory receptor 2AT4-like [Galeopterus variegatus]|uniref:Olfactory receptor n=1 Tax=Galeopterus variegatus TaxID=482537 RepID=A0ABM0S7B5_GALVR|nr:PREDICTED: olfactory receptor 2AT4-like [Galeopterus variegatus]
MGATACNGSENSSPVFYLVGIPSLPESLFLPVFWIFLLIYLLVLVGNALILVAVVAEPRLHKPMYFFLINLSALDILSTTTTVPKMLSLFLLGDHLFSFPACFLQMYLFHGLNCSEAFILVVMAYDRYVAICRPLHYTVLMTPQTNAALAASAWLTALLLPIPAVAQTSQMAFGPRARVYHCFCDHLAVVQASCSDTTYVAYRAELSLDFHIMGNVVFAILTPVLNPLIYTLRNKDVKAAITKITCPQDGGHSGGP